MMINITISTMVLHLKLMGGNNISNNTNYTSIVNDRHLKRLQEILEENKAGFRKLPGTELKNSQTGKVMMRHCVKLLTCISRI